MYMLFFRLESSFLSFCVGQRPPWSSKMFEETFGDVLRVTKQRNKNWSKTVDNIRQRKRKIVAKKIKYSSKNLRDSSMILGENDPIKTVNVSNKFSNKLQIQTIDPNVPSRIEKLHVHVRPLFTRSKTRVIKLGLFGQLYTINSIPVICCAIFSMVIRMQLIHGEFLLKFSSTKLII